MTLNKTIKSSGLICAAMALLLSIAGPFCYAQDYVNRPDVKGFIDKLVADHQFERSYLESIMSKAEKKQKIIDAITRPAEKTKPWHEYRAIFLGEKRVTQGVEFWRENKKTLEKASQQYGVDPEIIVAIIGVETRYGRYMGSYRVLDALATLGFDYPKRGKFFAKQLKEFFLLAREQKQDPLTLTGSYAGAMGYGQFIPSSYRAYAVDFDRDGVADIWNNKVDAIGSVANYFKQHGWRSGQIVMARASVKKGADESKLNQRSRPSVGLATWKNLGYSAPYVNLKPDTKAIIAMFEELEGTQAWFGFSNFYVITRYNRSHMYARAVFELSEAIKTRYSNMDKKNSTQKGSSEEVL